MAPLQLGEGGMRRIVVRLAARPARAGCSPCMDGKVLPGRASLSGRRFRPWHTIVAVDNLLQRAAMSLALAMLTGLLASCTTEPVRDSETTPVPRGRILAPQYLDAAPGTGAVAVKRDPGLMAGGCLMELLLDEQPVADLKRRERIALHLPDGDHLLGVRAVCPLGGHGLSEVRAQVSSDVALTFRIGVTSSGDAFIQPTKF